MGDGLAKKNLLGPRGPEVLMNEYEVRMDEIVDMFVRLRNRDHVLYYDHESPSACLVCGFRDRKRCSICKGRRLPLRKSGKYKPL